MNNTAPIKVSFSFYRSDMKVLARLVTELKATGAKVREATVLRAMIHLTPADEMITHAVQLTAAQALPGASDGDLHVTPERPTVMLPKHDVDKLDGVIDYLAKARIVSTRAFVMRAMLHAAPSGAKLAPAVKRFLVEFPNKPRGLSKIRLERKARGNG